jgi:CPA2 family monovalent cation:H+ antiporter-2
MPHDTALIATIAAGIGLAFVFGLLAARLRLPPLVGYLVAGIVVGPFTPGISTDVGLAGQLAEIGVILLMFGVGVHFSVRDLMAVRRVVVPGAVAQIAITTLLGAALARWWGWPWGGAIIFGLALSAASTVVLLRALEQQGLLDSGNGRVAVGWLIVEDVAMVLALVLLPALAGVIGGTAAAGAPPATPPGGGTLLALAVTLLKVVAFVLLMVYVGSRLVPRLLAHVARIGSRELFTLSVLALALGIAFGAAQLFGVSFALGAFFAGVVISESDLSHQAAAEALPLQDAFAVLFFVSVGMLFDPRVLVEQPLALVGTLLVILLGNAVASVALLLLLRQPLHTALAVGFSLGQIGEFSFILAGLGVGLGLLPEEGRSLILAAAIVSITLNPLVFGLVEPVNRWLHRHPRVVALLERRDDAPVALPDHQQDTLRAHAVIVGFGRVGGTIGRALERRGIPYVVIESNREWVETLRARGVAVLYGDATRPGILAHAQVRHARLLVVATPGAYQTREIMRVARQLNPAIDTVARTHTVAEQRWLERQGVGRAVMGERELALGMARYALHGWDVEPDDIERVLGGLQVPESLDGPGAGAAPPAGPTGVDPVTASVEGVRTP